jgi:hypothetical protein
MGKQAIFKLELSLTEKKDKVWISGLERSAVEEM